MGRRKAAVILVLEAWTKLSIVIITVVAARTPRLLGGIIWFVCMCGLVLCVLCKNEVGGCEGLNLKESERYGDMDIA